jgi:tRNA nucleotidyltransferase/poly(A) polymerase
MRSLIERLRNLLQDVEVYFVGGCVRDLLLERTLHDLDLAVAGDAIALARQVAHALEAAFVLLDEENGIARVVVRRKPGQGGSTIDFARMRGNSLAEDLYARDLTINTLAIGPTAFWQMANGEVDPATIIDPYSGQEDLAAGRLRAPSRQSFVEDPLRTMRAVRLAGELHFTIESATSAWIRETAGLLPQVSGERIRDELVRLLLCPQAAPYLPMLSQLELLPYVLPELAACAIPWQEYAWEMVCCLEWLISQITGNPLPAREGLYGQPAALATHPDLTIKLPHTVNLQHYLQERLADRPRRALLKLAALLQAANGEATVPLAPEVAYRLRLSNQEAQNLHTLLGFRAWSRGTEVLPRYVYRFYRDTGKGATGVLLLALADDLARAGPTLHGDTWERRVRFTGEVLRLRYERFREVIAPPRLLDGSELIRTLQLEPGPIIGDLIEGIREAQAAGEVVNREEALEWARRAIEN